MQFKYQKTFFFGNKISVSDDYKSPVCSKKNIELITMHSLSEDGGPCIFQKYKKCITTQEIKEVMEI